MWLSEQFAAAPAAEAPGLGEVTAGAERAAVKGAGQEKRLLPVLSPGGYAWSPAPGDRVLVQGECVAGRVQDRTPDPGEVLIYAGASAIRLCADGTIRITGRVLLNGTELGHG